MSTEYTADERRRQAERLRRKLRANRAERSGSKVKSKAKQTANNFLIGGVKEVRFEENSLGCLGPHNKFRQFIIRLICNPYFDHFILVVIVINTIIIGLSDYSHVDENNNLLLTSQWNRAVAESNIVFVVIFMIEMTLKIIGMGFCGRNGSYLSDPWNWLDLAVVLTGLITISEIEIPSIAMIRTFRVLRPLRSLRMVPGLRSIVNSIMGAIPELGGVFSLVLFLIVVFAITGMQVFGDASMHSRCRLTPYPVNTTWVASSNKPFSDYRCTSDVNFNSVMDEPDLTKSTSPWSKPKENCYWPVDDSILRKCNLLIDTKGSCLGVASRWCGSNFDALGNRRFMQNKYIEYGNGHYTMNDLDIYKFIFNYGYTNFDNFGTAVFTIFQAMTEEGWTNLMYDTQDAYGSASGAAYFCLLILCGSFFVMQLLLIVLEDNFHAASTAEKWATLEMLREQQKREAKEAERQGKVLAAETERRNRALLANQSASDDCTPHPESSIANPPEVASPSQEFRASVAPTDDEPGHQEELRMKSNMNYHAKLKNRWKEAGSLSLNEKHQLETESTTGESSRRGISIGTSFLSLIPFWTAERSPTVVPLSESSKVRAAKRWYAMRETLGRNMHSSISWATSSLSMSTRSFGSSSKSRQSVAGALGRPSMDGDDSDRSALKELAFNLLEHEAQLVHLPALTLDDLFGDDASDNLYYFAVDSVGCVKNAVISNYRAVLNVVIPADVSGDPNSTFSTLKMRVTELHANCAILVESKLFNKVSGFIILANCVILMSDHYPIENSVSMGLDATNAMLSIFFTIELMLKLFGNGVRQYSRDLFGMFDAMVVVISIVDICLSPPVAFMKNGDSTKSELSSASSFISILRCFRLFRMIKLAIQFGSIKSLLERVVNTFLDLTNYMLLLLIFLVIYTIVGVQFYANVFHFDEQGNPITSYGSSTWRLAPEISRYNFDNFNNAFASVFQIMTTENWNVVAYNIWRVNGPPGVLYPASIIIMGTFILMNLFLAILLNNFDKTSNRVALKSAKVAAAAVASGEDTEAPKGELFAMMRRMSLSQSTRKMSVHSGKRDPVPAPLPAPLHRNTGMSALLPGLNMYSQLRREHDLEAATTALASREQTFRSASVAPEPAIAVLANPPLDDKAATSLQPVSSNFPANSVVSAQNLDLSGESIDESLPALKLAPPAPLLRKHSSAFQSVRGFYTSMFEEDDPLSTITSLSEGSVSYKFFKPTQHEVLKHSRSKFGNQMHLLYLKVEHFLSSLFPKQLSAGMSPESQNNFFPLNDCDSMGLFSPDNPFRIHCAKVLSNPAFENFVLLLIGLSSICLVLDSPLLDPTSLTARALQGIEYLCTICFTIEMALKVIVLGLFLNPNSYFQGGWNVLDGVIVIISLMSLSGEGADNLKALKSLRAFRALRPLRVISRAPGLRVVVNSLITSIPDVINVFMVVMVVISIFAVIAVTFLKGDLRACQGESMLALLQRNTTYLNILTEPKSWTAMSLQEKALFGPASLARDFTTCSSWPSAPCCKSLSSLSLTTIPTSHDICDCWQGHWSPVAYMTFDNFPSALLAFFSISTTENWVDLMYAAVDAAGIDMQPRKGNNEAFIYFFIFFIIIGSFFALNLFIGVIIDNFEKTKLDLTGDMVFWDLKDIEWVKMQMMLRSYRPVYRFTPPKDWLGRHCFELQQWHRFEGFILLVIIANTIILAADYWGESDSLRIAFQNANMSFTIIFAVEMAIKMIGLRWNYFASLWNIFDCLVTLGSIGGLLAFAVFGSASGLIVTVVRVFRVLRVIRMIEGMGSAKRLLDTLMFTLPGIFNIACLLILAVFIYAVLGMQLFATFEFNNSYNSHANFRTFDASLLTLIRFATGEAWNVFMYDASVQQAGCTLEPEYDPNMCGYNDKVDCIPLNGCGNVSIFPYLLSYTLVVTMVMFNLFIGVIIEGFQEANEGDRKLIKKDTIATYIELWSEYDPYATCLMDLSDVESFLYKLPPPMGLLNLNKKMNYRQMQTFIGKVSLSLYTCENRQCLKVHFKDMLVNLATIAVMRKNNHSIPDHLHEHLDFSQDATYLATISSSYILLKSPNGTVFTTLQYYAARKLQKMYREKISKNCMWRFIRSQGTLDKREGQGVSDNLVSVPLRVQRDIESGEEVSGGDRNKDETLESKTGGNDDNNGKSYSAIGDNSLPSNT